MTSDSAHRQTNPMTGGGGHGGLVEGAQIYSPKVRILVSPILSYAMPYSI